MRPRHSFNNILERLPDEPRELLESMQFATLSEYKNLKDQLKGTQDHPPTLAKADFDAAVDKLGKEYCDNIKIVLSNVHFNEKVYCNFCEDFCYFTPRADPLLKHMRWTEIAGSVCRPWSSMGGLAGYLHEATLPMFVWAYSVAYFEPDDVALECVIGLNPAIILNSLNGDGEIETPKHATCRPLCGAQSPSLTYGMFSTRLAPVDLGIPSNGKRMFAWFYSNLSVGLAVPPEVLTTVFQDLFFHKCQLDASIYMVASDEFRMKWKTMWASRRGEDWWLDDDGGTVTNSGDQFWVEEAQEIVS